MTDAERDHDRWLFHEVLPSIRRHGCYPPPDCSVGDLRAVTADDRLAAGIAAGLMPLLKPLDAMREAMGSADDGEAVSGTDAAGGDLGLGTDGRKSE